MKPRDRMASRKAERGCVMICLEFCSGSPAGPSDVAGRVAQSPPGDNSGPTIREAAMSTMRRAIGLMSGTSLDGVDVAIITTDGRRVAEPGPALTVPYSPALRARLRGVLGGVGPVAEVEREITEVHADAVARFVEEHGVAAAVIGFHGHTILHRPAERRTWQIGDGALLARRTGIDVVCDFRSADVAGGGEGAPLVPLFHAALAARLDKPLAIVNIGGVANVTWLGAEEGAILAFDTGPGNAPIDDWALRHIGRPVDRDGALARAGRIDSARLAAFLGHPLFDRPPPKSLDRADFVVFDDDG